MTGSGWAWERVLVVCLSVRGRGRRKLDKAACLALVWVAFAWHLTDRWMGLRTISIVLELLNNIRQLYDTSDNVSY